MQPKLIEHINVVVPLGDGEMCFISFVITNLFELTAINPF